MKLLSALFASLAIALCADAQYFSEGWRPGQPVDRDAYPTAVHDQQHAAAPTSTTRSSRFSFDSVLTSGPVESLMGKLGVNMTEKLAKAKADAEETWDPRIPLITDKNYDELIVNEPLTPEEEADRVWFIIISATKGGKNAFSVQADDHFDKTFNKSLIDGDLPNVRWGRIDYINVTYLTTKWSIWQAPFLLVATDRGQSLRFYKANTVRLDPDLIYQFLKDEIWREGEPWNGPFAPGGQWEYIMHYWATALTYIYDFLSRFPRWLLMIVSAGVANFVMQWMHSSAGTDRPAPRPVTPAAKPVSSPAKPATETASTEKSNASTAEKSSASPAKTKGKQRKGGRK